MTTYDQLDARESFGRVSVEAGERARALHVAAALISIANKNPILSDGTTLHQLIAEDLGLADPHRIAAASEVKRLLELADTEVQRTHDRERNISNSAAETALLIDPKLLDPTEAIVIAE